MLIIVSKVRILFGPQYGPIAQMEEQMKNVFHINSSKSNMHAEVHERLHSTSSDDCLVGSNPTCVHTVAEWIKALEKYLPITSSAISLNI